MQRTFGVVFNAPTHWVSSTQGFLDASLAELGWSMNPLPLISEPLSAGRFVELMPGRRLDVPLHWQHARLGARLLDALTHKVTTEARRSLTPSE